MRIAQSWPKPATALSVLGHATLLALLAIEAPRHMPVVKQPVSAVDVMMVAPPRPQQAATGNSARAETSSQPKTAGQPSAPVRTARPAANERVAATEYFAGAVLSDPRNRETRQMLASLTSDERLIQLCNIEAMAQLKHWKVGFVPDSIVAYAMTDPSLTSTSLKAPGAAVHAAGNWYRLSFNCTATADLARTESFDFALGKPIPRQEWEQHSLPELIEGAPTD